MEDNRMAIRQELLDELRQRRSAASAGGGPEKISRRHAEGRLSARERVEMLFDESSFSEYGMHVNHACHMPGFADSFMPGDGVVTGTGNVDGRPVAVFSQDFTVGGGALGHMHAKKICDIMTIASETGIPVVAINDSGGARIQEGIQSLSGYGQVFYRNVAASGVVPQIAIIAGPCAGGAAYSPALMDFLIQTRTHSSMFICGPEVIKAATGQVSPIEQYGSAEAHATASGNIHFIAEDDRDAISIARTLLSYLPSNNLHDPPHQIPEEIALEPDIGMNELVPEDSRAALDIYEVIERLVDTGEWLEVQRDFAKNIVVGFARISGMVVGIVANQPAYKAGCLDIDSSDKAARFIRFCNAFNVPLVNLVDVPGFMPGLADRKSVV